MADLKSLLQKHDVIIFTEHEQLDYVSSENTINFRSTFMGVEPAIDVEFKDDIYFEDLIGILETD